MHRKASTSEPSPSPVPPKDRAVPPYLAFLLRIVGSLLRYGRQLDDVLPTKTDHPRFPTLAAGFGTHDIKRILAHVQRGILRAMMLQRFLLARAAQNRDIEPATPAEPAEATAIEALNLKLGNPAPSHPKSKKIDPDHPLHFAMPTMRELESQGRRRSVGRTIAEIALDLGVAPSLCEGATWNDILQALMHFGADLERFFAVQQRRRETFAHERENRKNNWATDWRDRPLDAVRDLLGTLFGELQSA